MRYRSWMLAGLLTQAGAVQAMGLGDFNLQSYLGAPLYAEMPLFSPGAYDRDDIRVRIARPDVYTRMGARYEPFHGDIDFDVREDAQGGIKIVASSRKRVIEPYLDIVVELSWPAGTSYRRYNVLLDPPAYARRWQHKVPVAEPRAIALTRARTAPVPATPVTLSDERYVVRHGDSLWKIARHLRSGERQSVHDLMQALYQANPHAFIGGDRNRLKLGAVLRLPASVPPPDVQIARQSPSPAKVQAPVSPKAASPAVPVAITRPRLDIAAELASAQQARVEALPDTLDGIKAAIARLQAEKLVLQAYQAQLKADMVAVLEQQIAATDAMLHAQQLLAGAREADRAAIPPATDVVAASSADEEPTKIRVEPEAMSETQASAPELTSADVRLRDLMQGGMLPSASPLVTVHQAGHDVLTPTPRLTGNLLSGTGGGSSLWYLMAMVPLGVLLVLMGMRSHRVQQIRRTEQIKDADLHDLVFGPHRDRTHTESPEQLRKAVEQIRKKAASADRHQAAVTILDPSEGRDDLKQMVDLYLVYSQYQKALNVILTEISKRPGRADLRLYLMRVYAAMGDWKAFDEQEDVLRRQGQQALLEQAAALRQCSA